LAKSEFDVFCRRAFEFLAARRVRYLVIGGLAVVVVGEPRLTGDVDVVVFAPRTEAEGLIPAAQRAGFEVDARVEQERLRRTGTLRFRWHRFQLDIILASLPFEETAWTRSVRKRLFGRLVRLPTPEDLILFKVLAGRDKDMLDAIGVVRRHGDRLDVRYLRATLRPICDLAEDMAPLRMLEKVLSKAAPLA